MKRKNTNVKAWILVVIMIVIALVVSIVSFKKIAGDNKTGKEKQEALLNLDETGCPKITLDLLTPNEFSRPQIPLNQVKGVVIHYVANPGSSAKANRNYFQGLKDSGETYASSHFIVGLEGEVEQCIPLNEEAYASNERNADTISIECCHPDETGEFNKKTYDTAVQLTAWLCARLGLSSEDVIRHYDVTGKACPLYYVENEAAWLQFKGDVQSRIDTLQKG